MSYNLEPHAKSSILIHIDSRDFTTSYSDITTHGHYILKDKIIIPSNQSALISLNSATIPYSFYNIRLGINDAISFKLFNNNTTEYGYNRYIIPAGNYSAFSLANNIKSNLTTLINDTGLYGNSDLTGVPNVITSLKIKDFVMNFLPDQQKYNFNYKQFIGTDTLTLTFLFNDNESDANVEIGFPDNNIDILSDTILGAQSINVIDINGSVHGVMLRSSLTSNNIIDSQNSNLSNIIARIPIQVQSGGIIFFNPRDAKFKALVKLPDIDSITLLLSDERNRPIDLNGLHFQASIQIDFIYDVKQIVPSNNRRFEDQQGIIDIENQRAESSKQAREAIANGRAEIIRNSVGELIVVEKKSDIKKRQLQIKQLKILKDQSIRSAKITQKLMNKKDNTDLS